MKAVVFTLGCKVNGYESASLITGLKELGYETDDKLCAADLYIINTCAVTAEAEKKSRQAIARARKFNKDAKIIVAGCASEKSPDDFLKKEGVTLVTGAKSKEKILSLLSETGRIIAEKDEYEETFFPSEGDRTRIYVKVQDGCDNFCSYCVIPYLRGRSRSRDPEFVVREIESVAPAEAVITGINLSSYGYGKNGLKELIDRLSGVNCRIRLGSLEAGAIDEGLLSSLKGLKDFAEHFHLSLQSGSDAVLKSMNRRYTAEEFKAKCALIRKYFPDAGITTDIIVGYPTEGEEQFKETLSLAEEVGFSDIHCFPYSPREGTVGAKLTPLSPKVLNARMEVLLGLKAELKRRFAEKFVGKTLSFLPEERKNGETEGYTGNYLRCYLKSEVPLGKITKVKIVSPYKDGAAAERV